MESFLSILTVNQKRLKGIWNTTSSGKGGGITNSTFIQLRKSINKKLLAVATVMVLYSFKL